MVHDIPRHFGDLNNIGDIVVDSLENIGSNLDKFHLAYSINQIANIEVWPENKLGITNKEIIRFYRDLVQKLLQDIKPN